jgi:hypothetical protein
MKTDDSSLIQALLAAAQQSNYLLGLVLDQQIPLDGSTVIPGNIITKRFYDFKNQD